MYSSISKVRVHITIPPLALRSTHLDPQVVYFSNDTKCIFHLFWWYLMLTWVQDIHIHLRKNGQSFCHLARGARRGPVGVPFHPGAVSSPHAQLDQTISGQCGLGHGWSLLLEKDWVPYNAHAFCTSPWCMSMQLHTVDEGSVFFQRSFLVLFPN